MRVGISTASFFNKAPTESAFDILRQLRCDTTEIFLNTFYEYEKPFIDALVARKGNINIHSIHALGTQFEPELYSASARVRNDAELFFRKVCYAGNILGAKFYTFHGPLRLKNQNYEFDYVKIGDRTNQLIEIAQSYGLKLSYENVHYSYFSEPDYFRYLSKQCPKLYGTLDTKQALLAGYKPVDYLDVIGDKLSTVHLCDVDKAGDPCMPGDGKFNFEKLFKALENRNYTGPLLMEVYANNYKELKDLKDAFDYLSACLVKIRN